MTWRALLVVVITLLPLAAFAPLLNMPLMNDEGIYAVIARGLLRGELPYRDLFDITPPGTYIWYALGFLALGEHIWVPRLILALCLCLTTLLIFVEGRLLFGNAGSIRAAFFMGVSAAFVQVAVFVTDEYLMLLPLTASYVAFTMALRRDSRPWLIVAGVCSGLAIVTNQTSAVHLLVLAYLSMAVGPPEKLKSLACLFLGAGAVFGVVALPYLVTGSFGDLWYGAVQYPLSYGGQASILDRLQDFAATGIRVTFSAGPLLLAGAIGALRSVSLRREASSRIVMSWLVGSLLALAATGHFFAYYFVGLVPPIALLAANGVSTLQSVRLGHFSKLGIGLAFLVLIVLSMGSNLHTYLQPTIRGKAMAYHDANLRIREAQSELVAEQLKERLGPQETIYNLGYQGELYFYADRQPPSRFLHVFPLTVDKSNVQELLRDLEVNKPRYIIDTQWAEYIEGWPIAYQWEVLDFVNRHYEHETRIYFDDELLKAHGVLATASQRDHLTFYGDLYRLKDSTTND